MPKYRKKPVEIEAIQWNGLADLGRDIIDWANSYGVTITYSCIFEEGQTQCPGGEVGTHELEINTLEGVVTAQAGDWVIKGVKNEFYPCKSDIFAETYEEVI